MSTHIHIATAADENYVPHAAVTMLSACQQAHEDEHLHFHFISNGVSKESQCKLRELIMDHGHSFSSYEVGDIEQLIGMHLHGEIAISSYSRLFLSCLLPQEVERLIYFDSDSVIADSLSSLWNVDLGSHLLGAVLDASQPSWNLKIDLTERNKYINAGMLLIPLRAWREEQVEQRFISFLREKKGRVFHHDQGVINAVLAGKILILPPRYNLMTFMYELTADEVRRLYKTAIFYAERELAEAKQSPCFIHFTPSLSNRPWVVGCRHPEVNRYRKVRAQTPWKDWTPAPDKRSVHVKLLSASFYLGGFWGLMIASKIVSLVSIIIKKAK